MRMPGRTFFHSVSLGHDFRRKKILLNIECVFRVSLQLLSEIFVILRRLERDMMENVYCLHVKYRLFLFDLNKN